MIARARIRQLEMTADYVKRRCDSLITQDQSVQEGFAYLIQMIDREITWLRQPQTQGVDLVEGGIYSLPLEYQGGMANLNFKTPDGQQILLSKDLEKFLTPISVPEKVEKQGRLL